MRKANVAILSMLGLLSCAGGVHAAEWTNRGEVGFVAARGNTTTETANAKIQVIRESEEWKNTFGVNALYGRASEIETAQRWDVRNQVDHFFGERSFWFVAGRYEQDRYSGFEFQGSASAGFGRRFIDTEATKLSTQIGAGYRSLRPEELIYNDAEEVIARIPGQRSEDVVANGALTFEHAFNENTKLLNNLQIEAGEANTQTRADLSLQVKMNASFALSLGYSVRNNSEPQPGLEKTDTLTTVNLVYSRATGD